MTVRAIDVANFFIDLARNLSNGKPKEQQIDVYDDLLIYLLYAAQCHSFKRLGRPLFKDDFFGIPVAESVNKILGLDGDKLELFNCYTRTDVLGEYHPDMFTDEEIEFLLDVFREYKDVGTCRTLNPNPGDTARLLTTSAIEKIMMNEPLPKFELNITKDEIVGYHDEEGHLVLPKEISEKLDDDEW